MISQMVLLDWLKDVFFKVFTGGNNMDFLAILNQLIASVEDLKLKLSEAEAAVAAEKQASYDLGFQDGAASIGADKIYSQAELDTKLEELRAVLVAEVDVKVAEAIANFKAELLAKFEEQQAVENESENAFKALLA